MKNVALSLAAAAASLLSQQTHALDATDVNPPPRDSSAPNLILPGRSDAGPLDAPIQNVPTREAAERQPAAPVYVTPNPQPIRDEIVTAPPAPTTPEPVDPPGTKRIVLDGKLVLVDSELKVIGTIGADGRVRIGIAPNGAPTGVSASVGYSGRAEIVADATGDLDLIGDKPGAAGAAPAKGVSLMEEFTPEGPRNERARQCYFLLAKIKKTTEAIARDLDSGGKEVTRLINTSEELSKHITELANVWPTHPFLRDWCGTAKRSAVMLNDELSKVPRKWTHVRWTFNDTVKNVRFVRERAKEVADQEPVPVAQVQNGKVVYIDPTEAPVNPAVAKKEEEKAKLIAAREAMRRKEDAKKNPDAMPVDLNSPEFTPGAPKKRGL